MEILIKEVYPAIVMPYLKTIPHSSCLWVLQLVYI